MSSSAPVAGSCTPLQRKQSTRPSAPRPMMPRSGSSSPIAVELTDSEWPAWSAHGAPQTGRRPSPDQEIVLLELGALHLVAHPNRRHAAASPLQRLVLLGLIFRFWLRALAGPAVGANCLVCRRGL